MLQSNSFHGVRRLRWQRFLFLFALLPALALLNSCGASNTATPSITVAAAAGSVNVLGTVQFTATVLNLSSTLVTWQVCASAGSSCTTGGNSTYGTIDSNGLYTAPATIPNTTANVVTITAIAQAQTSLTGTATLTILPAAAISAITTNLASPFVSNESVQFTATVAGGGNIAVFWYVNRGVCPNPPTSVTVATAGILNGNLTLGTISSQGQYTAPPVPPSGATIAVTAVSQVTNTETYCVTENLTFGNGALEGSYAFSTNGRLTNSTSAFFARAGSFTADGSGNLVGGLETYNQIGQAGGAASHNFTGIYSVGPDGRGTMQLCENISTACTSGAATVFFRLVVVTPTQSQIVEFSPPSSTVAATTGSGQMDLQSTSVFNTAGLAGAYSFDFSGFSPSPAPVSIVGEFSSNSLGTITTSVISSIPGRMDINNGGTLSQPVISNTSTYSISSNGQGTATFLISGDPTFSQLTFTFYMVSASQAKFIESDANAVVVGNAYKQQATSCTWGNNSLNGSIVFETGGTTSSNGSVTDLVNVTSNGSGIAAAVSNDENNAGTVTTGTTLGGNYAIDTCGRGTLSLGSPFTHTYSFYPYSTAAAVIQETTSGVVGHGILVQPQSGAFTFGTLSSFALNLAGTNAAGVAAKRQDIVGQFNTGATGSLIANTGISGSPFGTLDITNINGLGTTESLALTSGSLTAGGRSTMSLSSTSPTRNFVLYQVSPTKFYVLSTDTTDTGVGSLYNQF